MLKELAGRLNRAQQSLRFKVIASILVLVFGIGGFSSWLVYINAPQRAAEVPAQPRQAQTEPGEAPGDEAASAPGPRFDPNAVRDLLGSRDATLPVATGFAAGVGLALGVIWLGVSLTYLGLAALASIIAGPLTLIEATRGFGQLLIGGVILTASFSILMQAMRLALGGGSPTMAIARNVLAEAVRMKISVVFIVLLVFLLAGLPGFLDESQPLRFRVQSFLQYSVGGSFWVIALMTIFFAVGTVAFEQRDRIIWQTMSKPVRPIEYILGKWIGVMGLNAVLLTVSASGIFLFTEYLRNQPAQEEVRAFVPLRPEMGITTDRMLLESQVLVARAGAEPDPPQIRSEMVEQAVQRQVEDAISRDASLAGDERRLRDLRYGIEQAQIRELRDRYRSIAPGDYRVFTFSGLGNAKELNRSLTLRYKINAGGDDPTRLYRVLFRVQASGFPRDYVRQVVLNQTQTISFYPIIEDERGRVSEAITDDDQLILEVYNGNPFTGEVNPLSIRFPPEGLEILYPAGSYEMNFVCVMAALWVKLGFLAAVAIAAGTFVSFPVACMIGLVVLFAAETSGFLMTALQEYPFFKPSGEFDLVGALFRAPAYPIAWMFQTYAELRPTTSLVEGRLVPWDRMLGSALIIAGWIAAVLGIAWAIFRKRELAMYSGH